MRVTRLKVANFRVMEAAEFRFQPGFNLLVGINGVGKTSVLDALGACLSPVLKHLNGLRTKAGSLSVDDIRIGADALTLECSLAMGDEEFGYLIHKPRDVSVAQKEAGRPREQVHDTPEKSGFVGDPPERARGQQGVGRSLALLFSTRRAVPTERAPTKRAAAGGVETAFADAFAHRELRLGEFAAWIRVQKALSAERPTAGQVLTVLEAVVRRFLSGYANLRVVGEQKPKLYIDRADATLEARQLSDGERGALALVLDLTRRMAQANPGLEDPAAEAEAIVLIDEIDLHLHPKWQRQMVQNLTATFPKCQFIATTHSPQVIGEVEPERIQKIADEQVTSPSHSFGMDSSRVLEEIMNAPPRTKDVQHLLTELSRASSEKDLERARNILEELVGQLGEEDPEVTRARTLLEFLDGDE